MTEQDQEKRTRRALTGRWAVGKTGGSYRVVNRDNGGHVYTVTGDASACSCPDFEQRQGRCKHIEAVRLALEGETLDVQPLIQEDESGIHATFVDGACISLTVGGRTACSQCGLSQCRHFEAALPHYTRWLNEQAATGRWPAHRLAQLGIGRTNQPDQSDFKQEAQMQEQCPNWDEIKRQLAAPFHSYYIGWKAQATNKDKTRAMAVAYIDARTVMDRLDQVVGPGNWSDGYRLISAGSNSQTQRVCASSREFAVECTLTLFGVPKSDVGIAEEEDDGSTASVSKSAYSDALKRAAVKWGIGRYLYRLSKQWVGYDAARKQLTETPELPNWALPEAEKREGGSRGNGHGNNGSSDGLAAEPQTDAGLEQARAIVLPFGTRSHPEYKGKTLGELAAINGELIVWLAGEFAPSTDDGNEVKRAAQLLAKMAVAA
ncbi:MAG: SWIM zinc finger family protein [Anaerolineae bacterium]|nr:SWIM zinc finger family protein [Anaerolineae bacterium]